MAEHRNYTAISEFRVINRRKLLKCPDLNPYLKISVSPDSTMSNEEYLTVTVSGVVTPSSSDWVAMISPSSSNVTDCPLSEAYYAQTGDLSDLPLLCQYPVKVLLLPSPAKDFGWHDPGFIHTAVMIGLQPSSTFSYRYGSDSIGWSNQTQFRTPPAGGSDGLYFIVYGDMGKTPFDSSVEHYIQPGSLSVIKAVTDEVNSVNVDSIFHIGDISYATGFLVEWDFFLELINPVASQVTYMTAIGNHERDYVDSGSVYITPDSGEECGVAYETYFPMPTPAKDKPWYSIEQASVHFTVISTEHNWHRPMYTSSNADTSVDKRFVNAVEPLLLEYKVDLAFFGHVHNYERTCAVYQGECKAMPTKDANGVDTYNNSNYSAPVQAVIGMAGFALDNFTTDVSVGLGLEVVESCRSRPGGGGAVSISAWRRGSRPRGGGAMPELHDSPAPWKPRTICIKIHFDWVFAEAHQLEDLFMEPWVEATCGGGGEI
uniref:Purple acid phosphatase n=1 Tax=Fagus sylvatica TaxID=28930 RepID=A0A2N9EWS7_FAGSY